jgi:hypothetical protein
MLPSTVMYSSPLSAVMKTMAALLPAAALASVSLVVVVTVVPSSLACAEIATDGEIKYGNSVVL